MQHFEPHFVVDRSRCWFAKNMSDPKSRCFRNLPGFGGRREHHRWWWTTCQPRYGPQHLVGCGGSSTSLGTRFRATSRATSRTRTFTRRPDFWTRNPALDLGQARSGSWTVPDPGQARSGVWTLAAGGKSPSIPKDPRGYLRRSGRKRHQSGGTPTVKAWPDATTPVELGPRGLRRAGLWPTGHGARARV